MLADGMRTFDFAAPDGDVDLVVDRRWHAYSWPVPRACATNDVVARAESVNFLYGLQRKLTKVQRPVAGVPDRGFTRLRVDDRLSAEGTRVRKSAVPPPTFDRTDTESYPLPAPSVLDRIFGADSRWMNRGSEVRTL